MKVIRMKPIADVTHVARPSDYRVRTSVEAQRRDITSASKRGSTSSQKPSTPHMTAKQEIKRNYYGGNESGRSSLFNAMMGMYGWKFGGDKPRVAKRSEVSDNWVKRANNREVTRETRAKGIRQAFGLLAG